MVSIREKYGGKKYQRKTETNNVRRSNEEIICGYEKKGRRSRKLEKLFAIGLPLGGPLSDKIKLIIL